MQEVNIAGKKRSDPNKGQVVFDLAVRDGIITDSKGHVLTNTRVAVSTAQTLYGIPSLFFDGAAWLTTPNTNGDLWLAGEFTLEAHVYSLVPNRSFPTLFGNYNTWPLANALQLFVAHANGNANNRYSAAIAGTFPALVSTTNVRYNNWDHVAVTRNAVGAMSLWINGKLEASYNNTNALYGSKDIISIGSPSDSITAGGLNGYVNGLRVTNACRYTKAFTPAQF